MGSTGSGLGANLSFVPEADQQSSLSGMRHIQRPLATARCLLADDEPAVARAQGRFLEHLGAAVTSVGTVAAAMRALVADRWDLVVADLRFPDGDGEVILRQARALTPVPGLVVVSGTLDAVRPARLRKLGAIVIDKSGDTELLGCAAHAALIAIREPTHPIAAVLAAQVPAQTRLERALAGFALRYRLSPQQVQMLALLTARLGNKEIGVELGIAEESLRVQWGRVLAKIGVAGDAKAREGLLAEFARYCAGERY